MLYISIITSSFGFIKIIGLSPLFVKFYLTNLLSARGVRRGERRADRPGAQRDRHAGSPGRHERLRPHLRVPVLLQPGHHHQQVDAV